MGVPKEDTADNVIQHDFSVLSADGKLAPRDQKARSGTV